MLPYLEYSAPLVLSHQLDCLLTIGIISRREPSTETKLNCELVAGGTRGRETRAGKQERGRKTRK